MGAALCGQRSGAQHLDDFAARTAAAWRRRSAAECSLSRSRVARHGFMYVTVQTTLVCGAIPRVSFPDCPALYPVSAGFLLRQAETALAGAGCLLMVNQLFASLSLGLVALIVAAPLWY
jgi:hypothetical protein